MASLRAQTGRRIQVASNLATASTFDLLASWAAWVFATARTQLALDQTEPAGPSRAGCCTFQKGGAPKRTKLSTGIIGKSGFKFPAKVGFRACELQHDGHWAVS
jgi:hypothetical protein